MIVGKQYGVTEDLFDVRARRAGIKDGYRLLVRWRPLRPRSAERARLRA